jgi:serine/threonine protein phosphatase PrpC
MLLCPSLSHGTPFAFFSAFCFVQRCVMCRQGPNGQPIAIPLSTDQKPERADEKARILAHGGRVEPLPGPPGECGPARVWLAEADVPGLAMSRSIGDEVSQTVGVTSVPEILRHNIENEDIFAVWASDGVWEFLSDEVAYVETAALPSCMILHAAIRHIHWRKTPRAHRVRVLYLCV